MTELRLPRMPTLQKVELYGLLVLIAAAVYIGIIQTFPLDARYGMAIAAAFVAISMVMIGGMWLILPLYVSASLIEPMNIPGSPLSINQALAFLLIPAVVWELWRDSPRMTPTLMFVLYLIFTAYQIVVTLMMRPEAAPFPTSLVFFLFPFIALCFLGWRRVRIKLFFTLMMVLAFVTAVLPAYLEFLLNIDITVSGIKPSVGRIDGLSKDSIVFAYNMVWLVPFAVVFFLDSRTFLEKAFYGGVVLSFLMVTVLTFNRQTPIIIAVMAGFFLLMLRHESKRFLIGVAVAGAVVVSPAVLPKVVDRLLGARNMMSDYSLMHRYDKINIARNMWEDHFWFGIGFDHYRLIWRQYIDHGTIKVLDTGTWMEQYIDAGYIQIMTDFGIVGMALFVLLIIATGFLILRNYLESLRLNDPWFTNSLAALTAMMVQFLVANAISDALIRLQTIFVFALLCGHTTGLRMALARRKDEGDGSGGQDTPAS